MSSDEKLNEIIEQQSDPRDHLIKELKEENAKLRARNTRLDFEVHRSTTIDPGISVGVVDRHGSYASSPIVVCSGGEDADDRFMTVAQAEELIVILGIAVRIAKKTEEEDDDDIVLTPEGVKAYMKGSRTAWEWDKRVNEVVKANNGRHPEFWYEEILRSGFAGQTLKELGEP